MCVYLLDEECDGIRENFRQGIEEWEKYKQNNGATAYGD